MKKSNIRILRFFIIIVVLILSLVLFKYITRTLGSTKIDSVALYQYVSDVRYDYLDSSKLVYEEKEKASFYFDLVKENLDYSPLYVDKRVKLIMPEDFSIIYYDEETGFNEKKMLHLTSISLNNNGLEYQNNFDSGTLPEVFLYNGKGLYVLLEESYYEIAGSNYRLAPFSFVDYDVLNNYLRVFDFASGKVNLYEDIKDVKLTLTSQNLVIDLDTSMVSLGESPEVKKLLMSNIDYLDMYKN